VFVKEIFRLSVPAYSSGTGRPQFKVVNGKIEANVGSAWSAVEVF